MTTAVALLDTLRARGVELVAAGDRLRFRPVEAVAPEELEALRRFKTDLLALLQPGPALRLDPVTVREILGPIPSPEALRAVEAEIRAALAQLDREIQTGQLGSGPVLIRGIPLALWLPLDTLARLLARRSGRQEGSA